jgi:hypothetical protein
MSMKDAGWGLSVERKQQFTEELKDPEVRRMLAASANAEVGGQGSEATHAYLESVFNRASSRDKTLRETLTDKNYYPPSTLNKLDRTMGPEDQAKIDDTTRQIMQGSNVSGLGSGNESGKVRSGGAPITIDFGPHKDRIVRELSDKGWLKRQLHGPDTKYDKPKAWPEHGAKPIQYTGSAGSDSPLNKIKVDNRNTDQDVLVQNTSNADYNTQ